MLYGIRPNEQRRLVAAGHPVRVYNAQRGLVRLLHAPAGRATGQRGVLPARTGDPVVSALAILGAGKIGEAMLAGLLGGGRSPDSLMFTERYPERVAELTQRYGVPGVETDEAAASGRPDRRGQAAGHRTAAGDAGAAITRASWWCRCARGCPPRCTSGCRRDAGGQGDAEHPDAGGGGDECDLRRIPRRPRNTCSWCRTCCPRSARWSGCPRRSRTPSPRCRGPARHTSSSWSRR